MELKTKFDIYDTVYFLWDNRVERRQITDISIQVYGPEEIKIRYSVYGISDMLTEKEVFATKEELINSL